MSKKTIALILKFTISIGLIWYLLHNIDTGSAWTRMSGADPAGLAIAGLVMSVQILISILRWRAVMLTIEAVLPFWQAARIYLIGLFFNQVLPSAVGGDAVRMYKGFRAGLSIQASVHGVMLERMVTVLALLILVAAATPFLQSHAGQGDTKWMLSFSVMMLAVGIGGIAFVMFLDRVPQKFRSWRFARALSDLASDTRRTFLSPLHTPRVLGWGILGHVAIASGVFFIAKSIDLHVTVLDCMVLMPPVILITTIPISIAGWGVREGAMIAAFALVGVQADDALVLSILFGMMVVIFAIPGGIIWLLTTDKVLADIPAEKQT
jgi:uncharacterized membrane protein YbhN (UPF0104 family)